MSNTSLIRAFQRRLHGALKPYGFTLRLSEQSCYRNTGRDANVVHMAFAELEEHIEVAVNVAVRLDEVERLVQRRNILLTAKERLRTFTLGVDIGELACREPLRLCVASDSDVADAVDRFGEEVRLVGLAFFDEFGDYERAYDILARDDSSARMHCPSPLYRALRACALLVVLGREEELPALARAKMELLQRAEAPACAEFGAFLDDLGYSNL